MSAPNRLFPRTGLAGLAAALTLSAPPPAGAQQVTQDTIVDLWTTFFAICGPVAADPVGTLTTPQVQEGYAHTLVIKNDIGNRVFVSHVQSGDGRGVSSEYGVLSTGQMAVVDCTVTYNGLGGSLDSAAIRDMARTVLEADGTMRLVGGQNAMDVATGYFSQGNLGNTSSSFIIEGAIDGTDLAIVANFDAELFEFAIVGSVVLP